MTFPESHLKIVLSFSQLSLKNRYLNIFRDFHMFWLLIILVLSFLCFVLLSPFLFINFHLFFYRRDFFVGFNLFNFKLNLLFFSIVKSLFSVRLPKGFFCKTFKCCLILIKTVIWGRLFLRIKAFILKCEGKSILIQAFFKDLHPVHAFWNSVIIDFEPFWVLSYEQIVMRWSLNQDRFQVKRTKR